MTWSRAPAAVLPHPVQAVRALPVGPPGARHPDARRGPGGVGPLSLVAPPPAVRPPGDLGDHLGVRGAVGDLREGPHDIGLHDARISARGDESRRDQVRGDAVVRPVVAAGRPPAGEPARVVGVDATRIGRGRADHDVQVGEDDRRVPLIAEVEGEIVGVVEGRLLDVGQQEHRPPVVDPSASGNGLPLASTLMFSLGKGSSIAAGGQECVRRLEVVHPEAELLEVVGALGAAGRLAGRLDRGQEQADQDRDDRDDDQQLDQREAPAARVARRAVMRTHDWFLGANVVNRGRTRPTPRLHIVQ